MMAGKAELSNLAKEYWQSQEEPGLMAASLRRVVQRLEETMEELQEKAKALEETNRRLEEKVHWLSTLFRVSTELSSISDLKSLCQRILDVCIKTLNAEAGSLLLLDMKSRTLVLYASRGLSKEASRFSSLRLGERIAGRVALEGEPLLLIDGLHNDPRFSHIEARNDIKSALSVPLKSHGQVLGVLNLNRLSNPANYTQEDLNLLSTIGNQMAMAIENALLREKSI